MTHNEKNVKLNLKRIEICDLLIACTAAYEETEAKKWIDLHDKLKSILEAFDEKEGYGIFVQ